MYYISIASCEHHNDVNFLPGTFKKYHDYHTVEGLNVTFTYDCYGSIADNWWAVDGYPISRHSAPNTYDYKKELSYEKCINILTLILYNVRMNYTNNYSAYPSRSGTFNRTGLRAIAHLSEELYGCRWIATIHLQVEYCQGYIET